MGSMFSIFLGQGIEPFPFFLLSLSHVRIWQAGRAGLPLKMLALCLGAPAQEYNRVQSAMPETDKLNFFENELAQRTAAGSTQHGQT